MALDELLDEHEQGEKVRGWLKDNALGLIGGLVLGLALIGGGKWWTQRAHQERVATGETYDRMVEAVDAGDLDKAKTEAAALAGTKYAALAALDLAKAEDQVCSMGSSQSFGVAGAVDGNSACADSVWEIRAEATDMETEAQVQVTQGVAVRVARDDVTNNCPTT